MKHILIISLLLLAAPTVAFAAPPTLFFSDITSGPATGGEGGAGAYVTIYGNNLSSPTVTIAGQSASVKLQPTTHLWYQKMAVQVPSGVSNGATTIQVTTAEGSSNTLPFTVRSGNIYCVSTSGNDGNTGTFSAGCWRTIVEAKNSMSAGDIAYVQNGVNQTAIDDYNANVSINGGSGSAANPYALVTYPGATATIGTTSSSYALRTPSVSGTRHYWVLAGFNLIAGNSAVDLVTVNGWRVIGNDLTCPEGAGQSACFHTDTVADLKFFGNSVHDVGDQSGSIDKYYHAVYFTTNSNHVDAGWNQIVPNPDASTTSGGCRAIQFYSTGGSDEYDLHVHDNVIHDAICDGINFATVDPSQGTVEAYNNLVYHVGTGPDPENGSSNYSCVVTGGSGSGSVQVYNNTFSDCGSRKTTDAGAFAPYIPIVARNNVTYQLSGETYVNANAPAGNLSGSNNVWYGVGNGPTQTTGNINANPLFVSLGTDFRLGSSSPAINAGVNTGLAYDVLGMSRPQGGSFDAGAYEYASGGDETSPAAPSGLAVE